MQTGDKSHSVVLTPWLFGVERSQGPLKAHQLGLTRVHLTPTYSFFGSCDCFGPTPLALAHFYRCVTALDLGQDNGIGML